MRLDEYQRNFDVEQHNWWFVGVRWMVSTLMPKQRPESILDVGCGTGSLLEVLKQHSDNVIGVDISPQALALCRQRGRHSVIQADGACLPLQSRAFDLITAIGVIEHIEDDTAFLAEMARLLRPGGTLIMLTASFPYLWSEHDVANHHKRRYYLRACERQILSAGFETRRFSHLNFLLFPAIAPMLLLHRLVRGLTAENPRRIIPTVPRLLNAMLTRILYFEACLMRWVRLPWGISMIGAFRRCDDPA